MPRPNINPLNKFTFLKKFISNIPLLILFFGFNTYILRKIALVGIDPLHDATIIVPVYALRDGYTLFSNVAEYKGPFTPIVLNSILRGDLLTIGNLKLLSYLFTFLSALITFLILKKQSQILAFVLPTLWICSTQATSLIYSRPWPGKNQLDTANKLFLLILIILLYLVNFIKNRNSSMKKIFLFLIIASILVGCLVLIRIQGFFMICIWLLFIFSLNRKYLLSKNQSSVLVFITFMPFIYFILLFKNKPKVYSDWLNQILLVPLKMSEDNQTMVGKSTIEIFKVVAIFTLMSSIFLVILALFFKTKKRFEKIFVSLTTIFLFISIYIGLTKNVNPQRHLSISNWFILVSQWSPMMPWYFSYSLMVLTFLAFLISKIRKIRNPIYQNFRNVNVYLQVILAIGLQGLIFLYPNTGNLWNYSLVVFTSSFIVLVSLIKDKQRAQTKVLTISLVPFLFINVFLSTKSIYEKPSIYNSRMLMGISDFQLAYGLDEQLMTLEELNWNKFLNICNRGILTVFNGHYASASARYGTYDFMKYMDEGKLEQKKENILLCGESSKQLGFYLNLGYSIKKIILQNSSEETIYLALSR